MATFWLINMWVLVAGALLRWDTFVLANACTSLLLSLGGAVYGLSVGLYPAEVVPHLIKKILS